MVYLWIYLSTSGNPQALPRLHAYLWALRPRKSTSSARAPSGQRHPPYWGGRRHPGASPFYNRDMQEAKNEHFPRDFLKFSSFIKFSHLGATKSPFSAGFSHETQHLLSQNYSKLMFCARRPLIFMTCHKVPRLPRQYTMSALDAALPTIKHVIKMTSVT